MFAVTNLIAIALLSPVQAPTLKFTKGEVMKYASSLKGSNTVTFKGSTQAATFAGSNVMTITVTQAGTSLASMRVTYSGATGSVKITSLPPELKNNRAEIEKQISDSLKAGLNAGARTQTVNPRGVTTYTLPMGDGKTMTISDGAFLMLVLPQGAMTSGKTWTANIRLPVAEASGTMKVQYTYHGLATYASQQCHKMTFSSADSKNAKQGEVTMSMKASIKGTIYLTSSGKVVYGDVNRSTTTTLTHSKEGTRTQKRESIQTFTKT